MGAAPTECIERSEVGYFHLHLFVATQQPTTESLLLHRKEPKVNYAAELTFGHVNFNLIAVLTFVECIQKNPYNSKVISLKIHDVHT